MMITKERTDCSKRNSLDVYNIIYQTKMKVLKSIIALSFLAVAMGCNRDTNTEVNPDDLTTLQVDVAGIIDEEEGVWDNQGQAKANAQEITAGLKSGKKSQVFSMESLDMVPRVERDTQNRKSIVLKSTAQGAGSAKGVKAVAMTAGNKYRLFLFNPNGSIYKSVQAISGTRLNIPVIKNVAYTWAAYTYNNTTDVPDITGTNNPTARTLQTGSFLHATSGTSTVTVTGAGNQNRLIAIAFKRKNAAMNFTFNGGTSLNRKIKSITAQLVNTKEFYTGAVNLKTGVVSDLQPYTVSQLNFITLASPNYEAGTQWYYTAKTGAIAPSIKVTNLVYQDGSGADVVLNKPVTVSFNPFNVAPNYAYRTVIDMYEGGLEIDGITWARYNLHTPQTRVNKFRDTYSYTVLQRTQDYFGVEEIYSWDGIYKGDPCLKVAPEGTWITPSRDDFRKLLNHSSTVKATGSDFYEFTTAQNEKFRLYTAGYYEFFLGWFTNGIGNRGLYMTTDPAVLNTSSYALSFYKANPKSQFTFDVMSAATGRATVRCRKK